MIKMLILKAGERLDISKKCLDDVGYGGETRQFLVYFKLKVDLLNEKRDSPAVVAPFLRSHNMFHTRKAQ